MSRLAQPRGTALALRHAQRVRSQGGVHAAAHSGLSGRNLLGVLKGSAIFLTLSANYVNFWEMQA